MQYEASRKKSQLCVQLCDILATCKNQQIFLMFTQQSAYKRIHFVKPVKELKIANCAERLFRQQFVKEAQFSR